MPTNYPSSLDTTTQLPDGNTDATVTAVTHAQQHDNLSDAVIAIETALGITPYGSYATVKAAIADMVQKTPSAGQTIQPSVDAISLIFKLFNNVSIANFWEAHDSTNNIKAYLDHTGLLNVQSLNIAGSPIASTNLSDHASLAFLNSPAFTGTPTAPTPTSGDNSTKIATTAFVETAIANLLITFNTQTTNYTLVLLDNGKVVEMNLAGANTLTVPLNSSVAFPIGTQITVAQLGAGTTTIAGAGGVTLRSYNNNLILAGQDAMASLIKRGTDDWWVAGNLV